MFLKIQNMIERCLDSQDFGRKKIIIYPFNEIGMNIKKILNEAYGITDDIIIVDDRLNKYNSSIMGSDLFAKIDCSEYFLLLSAYKLEVNNIYYEKAKMFFPPENIFTIGINWYNRSAYHTEIGKYSSGPLCKDNPIVKSIGAFCSFAEGVCVHGNHAMEYITTHPMLYKGSPQDVIEGVLPYEVYNDQPWYFEGADPNGKITGARRITIGNDVWLGRNVVIVNYSNIGNGVIAGAGAVITRDVPDYAVVVGVPAKIVRYRYNEEQIKALNSIQWWDWSDEVIKERFNDFYLPIDEFIRKYY